MADQTEAERQSQERVDKAERINMSVAARMAQPLTPPGVVVKGEASAPKKVLKKKPADTP